jgi:hypothetical protein
LRPHTPSRAIGPGSLRPDHKSVLQKILQLATTEGLVGLRPAFAIMVDLLLVFSHGFQRELVSNTRNFLAIAQRQLN